jgi:transcriptional regulator with XRE-family HTH domain
MLGIRPKTLKSVILLLRILSKRNLLVQSSAKSSIRELRKSVGLSSDQVAKRLHRAGSSIRYLESSEVAGSASISNLAEVAQELGFVMQIQYLPIPGARDISETKADVVAKKIAKRIQVTMAIEQQSLSALQLEDITEKVRTRLLQNPKTLWG